MARGKRYGAWRRRTLLAAFLRAGWVYSHEGKHGTIYYHPKREGRLEIPRTNNELHDETLARILKSAKVSRREFLVILVLAELGE